jgi:hypothetical protein
MAQFAAVLCFAAAKSPDFSAEQARIGIGSKK